MSNLSDAGKTEVLETETSELPRRSIWVRRAALHVRVRTDAIAARAAESLAEVLYRRRKYMSMQPEAAVDYLFDEEIV
jgi:hypothetical protein